MKILYVGELEDHARSWQRFVAMRELGHQVTGISTVPVGHRPLDHGAIVPRVLGRLGRPLDPAGANRRLASSAGNAPLDVIWIEKGLMLRAPSLAAARAAHPGAVLAFYSEDDMTAPHNQSRYFRDCLPLYDVVFTTKSYNCAANELPALGARLVHFVDKAYDRRLHRPVVPTPARVAAVGADVGFIGSFETERARKLLTLAHAGLSVRVWGNGWNRMTESHPRLRLELRPLFNDDYVTAICATKINLCFLRKANRDLQTDRTMEIPACGAFMLAERTAEHRRLFEEDREAVFFDIDDDRELIEKARHYLSDDEARHTVAAAGRRRCETSGYSHHDRVGHMLSVCADVPIPA